MCAQEAEAQRLAGLQILRIYTSDVINFEVSEVTEVDSEMDLLDNKVVGAIVAKVQKGPGSYKQSIKTNEKLEWSKTIKDELDAMQENQVWTIVDRPISLDEEEEPNIIKMGLETQRNC